MKIQKYYRKKVFSSFFPAYRMISYQCCHDKLGLQRHASSKNTPFRLSTFGDHQGKARKTTEKSKRIFNSSARVLWPHFFFWMMPFLCTLTRLWRSFFILNWRDQAVNASSFVVVGVVVVASMRWRVPGTTTLALLLLRLRRVPVRWIINRLGKEVSRPNALLLQKFAPPPRTALPSGNAARASSSTTTILCVCAPRLWRAKEETAFSSLQKKAFSLY